MKLRLGTSENRMSVFERISWWDSQKVAQAKVMVVGAGALGNEVLKNLALLNVGYILIVDFDTIEYSNLSRSILFRESDCGQPKEEVAAAAIMQINPGITVQHIHGDIAFDIGLGVFRRMDVIIGCLDNRVARLYINRHCYKAGKIWIDGGIENLAGQLDVFQPGKTCYECRLKPEEWKVIQFREGCTDVAQRNANFGRIPTTPISSSIIGALQVQEALKVINENSGELSAGKHFFFNGMHNTFIYYDSAPLQEFCESHVTCHPVIELQELSSRMTVEQMWKAMATYLNTKDFEILLDYDIILELCGEKSEVATETMIPAFRLSDAMLRQFQVIPGETVMKTKTINRICQNFPFPQLTLQEIGIPPLQVLKVEALDDIHWIELSGDFDMLPFQKMSSE